MLDDFAERDPHNTDFYAPARGDFDAYVRSLLDEEQGLNLREGWVPCTHRWLVTSNNAVAGVARLRHRIDTPFLLQDSGHIGYDVAPSYRGRGYGHVALRVSLDEAARRGISRVLLYASEHNSASRAVIERAGGFLNPSPTQSSRKSGCASTGYRSIRRANLTVNRTRRHMP